MNQFFARVVELREEKYVKYDGKFTVDSSARGFLEMTNNLHQYAPELFTVSAYSSRLAERNSKAPISGQYT